MKLNTPRIAAVFLAGCGLAAWTAAQQPSPPPSPEIGYKSAADAEQKKTLLLKDFQPTAMLHTSVHKVDRAKYYVIGGNVPEPFPPA